MAGGIVQITDRDPSKFASALAAMHKGKMIYSYGTFTLAPGAASTTVSHPNCSPGAAVVFSATTADAAAEIAAGVIRIPQSTVGQGSFVVNHVNNAQADRTFFFIILGGN